MNRIYRGVIIKESLNAYLLYEIKKYITSSHTHFLDKRELCTIFNVNISWNELHGLCKKISINIKPFGYYAHFISRDKMLVCFPNKIFSFKRGDAITIEECREFGRKLGIKDKLMKFELLFDVEHPNE